MDRYGYILKPNTTEKKPSVRYHKDDLELMTTFQLREICRKEKIIQGMINPMDKEELIHVILRFRGAEEYYLIEKPGKEGSEAMAALVKTTKLKERQDLRISCSSKIVAMNRRLMYPAPFTKARGAV